MFWLITRRKHEKLMDDLIQLLIIENKNHELEVQERMKNTDQYYQTVLYEMLRGQRSAYLRIIQNLRERIGHCRVCVLREKWLSDDYCKFAPCPFCEVLKNG